MIRPLPLALAMGLALASPATAHKLRVFATVEGDAITGYAFFIGGGRARGTPWIAKDAAGAEIARGETDGEGGFRLVPASPATSNVTVTVDTREGHVASAVVAAARLGGPPPPPELAATSDATEPVAGTPSPATADAAQLAALVDAAVARQVAPLLQRVEEMDGRLRFTDIVSGLFLIIGLAGIALWTRSRRR